MCDENVTIDYDLLDHQLKTMGLAIEFFGRELTPRDRARVEKVLRKNVEHLEGLYELCVALWERRPLTECKAEDGWLTGLGGPPADEKGQVQR